MTQVDIASTGLKHYFITQSSHYSILLIACHAFAKQGNQVCTELQHKVVKYVDKDL
ncbi:MAG: hypothetical protein PUP90_30285 [Nostoc sp. S4]|nr:hypothetical protein [Nostoc sp. S4]